jgi:hypothetical protein
MLSYSSRYVHKISPRDTDTGPDVTLTRHATEPTIGTLHTLNRKTLGAELRGARVLCKGESLYAARLEPDGRIVAFPRASIWHSIILTPKQ